LHKISHNVNHTYFTLKHHTKKRHIICMYVCMYVCYYFYTLRPTGFAHTYCFTILKWILLKFCDIENLWWCIQTFVVPHAQGHNFKATNLIVTNYPSHYLVSIEIYGLVVVYFENCPCSYEVSKQSLVFWTPPHTLQVVWIIGPSKISKPLMWLENQLWNF